MTQNAPADERVLPDGAENAVGAVVEGTELDEIAATARGRRWYILHTYSGYENKVKRNLETAIKQNDLESAIYQVVIPEEEEIVIQDGQRKTVKKKLFPGYVLMQTVDLGRREDELANRVRQVIGQMRASGGGVTGFVPDSANPQPMDDEEVVRILRQMKTETPRVKVGFHVGDKVRIIDGPFEEFSGEVDNINTEKGKVKVLVSFFGRETPVELDFLQVERI